MNPVLRAARVVARLSRIVEQECLSEGFGLAQYRILLFAAREPRRAAVARVPSGLPAVEHSLDREVEREITTQRIEARPLVARR